MASALLIPSKVQESTAINCLFLEHLARHEYTYSLQVFVNESGLADRKFSREDLLRMLGMHHSRTVYDKLSQNTNKDRSLVSDMLRLLSDTHSLFESRWVHSTSHRARCATYTRARAHTHTHARALVRVSELQVEERRKIRMEEHAAVRGEVELAKARIESELSSSLQLAQACCTEHYGSRILLC
jgi:hypothetical protein